MSEVKGYAAAAAKAALAPYTFERRSPREHDVVIDIRYCGICHTDIHQSRDEWGGSIYPMVPGHEIAGVVSAIGDKVTKYKVGDKVGVGCFVDSCRDCDQCESGLEQYCSQGLVLTYNARDHDGAPTVARAIPWRVDFWAIMAVSRLSSRRGNGEPTSVRAAPVGRRVRQANDCPRRSHRRSAG